MASAATSVPPGSGAPGGGTVASTGPHPPPASSAPPPQTSVVPLPSQHHGSGPPPPSHNVQPPTGLSGGPTSSQHYSLRWNNHQSHVLNAFDALLQNESLVDCTLVCEDTSIRAHKVVLSACSPYFQKIFMDNPHKNPIIILKDVRGWEVQCIVDFMYKGETSVPEAQLTGLIKAAEGLKVRGLTSSDQVPRNANLHVDTSSPRSRHSSPMNVQVNGYHHGAPPPSHHPPSHRGYSSSPARSYPSHHDSHHHDSHHGSHHAKIPHLTGPHSNQSSPMSLTNHQDDRDRAAHMQHNGDRLSPPNSGINGSGPRRKQARPRRRSGDSVGNSSLDLSKSDSPINAGTPYNAHHVSGLGRKDPGSSPTSSAGSSQHNPSHLHDDATPENLSMKRPSSSPAINLVKTETLLEQQDRARATSASSSELSQRAEREALRRERDRTHSRERTPISDGHGSKPVTPSSPFLPAAAAAAALHGMHHFQEHPARQELEALQALDYMRAGGGLPPHFPPPPGHPLNGHSTQLTNGPGGPINASSLAGLAAVSAAAAAQAASAGRPTSTPSTPSNNAFGGKSWKKDPLEKFGKPLLGPRGPKGQHSAPRGGPPRSWTNDELTKALENVWNKRMTTSQASRMYGIPYNSLLMYVRGKYGKSLKLDKLKKTTPAAHDSLNTIGNSRSTPKEKLLTKKISSTITSGQEAEPQPDKGDDISKLKSHEGTDLSSYSASLDMYPFAPGSPLFSGLGRSHSSGDGPLMTGVNSPGRIKELIHDMQQHQAFLSNAEQLRNMEKTMSSEQAKIFMPLLLERQAAEFAAMEAERLSSGEAFLSGPGSSGSVDGSSDGRPSSHEHDENALYSLQKDSSEDVAPGSALSEKERHIRQIIMQEASRRGFKDGDDVDPMDIAEDSNDEEPMSDHEADNSADHDDDNEEGRETDNNKTNKDKDEEDTVDVVDEDDDEKDDKNKAENTNREETDSSEKNSSEDGNGNEKKVNLRIDAKEVSQIASKLAVKSSAEISAK